MNSAESVRPAQTSTVERFTNALPGWLLLIAALWLLVPSGSTQFHADVFDAEPKAQATSYLQLGVGSASWLTLHREGIGPSTGGMTEIQWQPRRLAFHPGPMTVLPLVLLLLAVLMGTTKVGARLDPSRALDRLVPGLLSLGKRVQPFGPALSNAIAIGLCSSLVFIVALPDAHETVLRGDDVGQLKARLSEQLAAGNQHYDMRLETTSGEQTQLVIRRYSWWLSNEDPFAALTVSTELQPRDLWSFRIRRNPAIPPLVLTVMVVAFAVLASRERPKT